MVGTKDLINIGLVFVLGAVALSIGAEVLHKTSESFDTYTTTNESVAFTATNTCIATANVPIVDIVEVLNETLVLPDEDNLAGGTWHETCGQYGESMQLILNATYVDTTTWNVTYTHRNTPAYKATHNFTSGEHELATWTSTIALVLAAALVLGIVMRSWMGKDSGI